MLDKAEMGVPAAKDVRATHAHARTILARQESVEVQYQYRGEAGG